MSSSYLFSIYESLLTFLKMLQFVLSPLSRCGIICSRQLVGEDAECGICSYLLGSFRPQRFSISSFPCCLLPVFCFTNHSSNRINDAFPRHFPRSANVGERTTYTLFGLETDSNRRTIKVCHYRCVLYQLSYHLHGVELNHRQHNIPNPLLGFYTSLV